MYCFPVQDCLPVTDWWLFGKIILIILPSYPPVVSVREGKCRFPDLLTT